MFGVVLDQMNKYGRIAMCGSISVYNEKKDLKDVKGIFYNPLNVGTSFNILLQLLCFNRKQLVPNIFSSLIVHHTEKFFFLLLLSRKYHRKRFFSKIILTYCT